MTEQSAEKQHQATARRIDDLKKKGQTMRSRDLASGLIFISAVIMLLYMAPYIASQIKSNFTLCFSSIKSVSTTDMPSELISAIAMSNFSIMIPIFIVLIIVAFLSPYIFGGWNFSIQSIHFKGETLNPISNLGNIFSRKMIFNILKSMLKVSVILSVLILFAFSQKISIAHLSSLPLATSISSGLLLTKDFIVLLSLSLILIILYDVATNYFEFKNRIKMTTQELKDEFKETEGNVDVKRKLRSIQIAILKQRLSITVPKATVIITNPTHYAIAIRYNEKNDKAPKVVAKGKGYIAKQIRQLAIANNVPIYQAPLLARAIFNTTKLNAEVNPGLYTAVAIVLSYVHQLRHYQHGMGQQPQYVSDLKIPDEFIYHE